MTKEVFQLEVQINTNPALTGLDQVDKKLKQVKDSADKAGKGTPTTGINALTTATKGLQSALTSLGPIIASIGFVKIAQETVSLIANFETLNNTLTIITGSTQGATAAMNVLKSVSAVTPFSIQQLGAAFVNMKANGVDPSIERLKLFADVASVTGNKVQTLSALSNLFSRNMQGGLGLEDLNILANAGIPVFDILAKKLNVTRGQIAQLGQSAEGAGIILRTLEGELGDRFGGAAARSMHTLNGQFDTLIKNMDNLAMSIGEAGVKGALTSLIETFKRLLTANNGSASAIGSVFTHIINGVNDTIIILEGFFHQIGRVYDAIKDFMVENAGIIAAIATTVGLIVAFMTGIGEVATAMMVAFRGLLALAPAIDSMLVGALGRFAAGVIEIATAMGILGKTVEGSPAGKLLEKYKDSQRPLESPTAEGVRKHQVGDAGDQASAARALADQQRAADLAVGRSVTVGKILDSLKEEINVTKQRILLGGISKQQEEASAKIADLKKSMKDKLIAAGKTEAEAEKEIFNQLVMQESGIKQVAAIRSAVADKYAKESAFYFITFKKANDIEIAQLGMSNNERDKANKLKEIQVALGKTDAEFSKVKAQYETQITKSQEARITDSLTKNLDGIKKETEYLKLSNDERERRIALDQAAQDAGFKTAQDLTRARPREVARISEAIGAKQQTVVDVAGKKQIEDLREESALLSILNDQEREREKKKLDIYKAIDPEGKGKKINEMQKIEIENLLATIEAQNKLLEVNKKIEDGFSTLGTAVTDWALGGENAIKRVRLALVQLIALQAFKSFAGGMPTGATGSFISGILGGLSGARAEGGPVSAGKTYLVGEKRPELFVPSSNGYIVPNTTMLSAKSGATHISVAPNLIIQGSVTGQSELENMFDQYAQATANQVQSLIISQRGQNGILAR